MLMRMHRASADMGPDRSAPYVTAAGHLLHPLLDPFAAANDDRDLTTIDMIPDHASRHYGAKSASRCQAASGGNPHCYTHPVPCTQLKSHPLMRACGLIATYHDLILRA
jgi:hypothetical protein